MTFLFLGLKVHYLVYVLVRGFNFRLGTYNIPEGPSGNPYGEARSAEFDGTDGWDGPEKCPLILFILCRYMNHMGGGPVPLTGTDVSNGDRCLPGHSKKL